MNDDLELLASSYLDGDVTADEHARVEGDAELLATVERLRAVRMLMSDVEPTAISTRERQLAAALDVWDRLPETERTGARREANQSGIDPAAIAGAASVTAPTPLASRRRTGSPRWLAGAAAALVLVLAGGVALQLGTGDDDSGDETAGVREVDDAASLAAPSATSSNEAAATAGGEAADAEAALTEGEQLDTGIDSQAPPGENVGLTQLLTTEDLADFAAAAASAPIAPEDVPAATSADDGEERSTDDTLLAEQLPVCLGVDLIVGPAVFVDVVVVVGIDEGRNQAIAYRAETCAEVARARLP